jgi:hypothetical protein
MVDRRDAVIAQLNLPTDLSTWTENQRSIKWRSCMHKAKRTQEQPPFSPTSDNGNSR